MLKKIIYAVILTLLTPFLWKACTELCSTGFTPIFPFHFFTFMLDAGVFQWFNVLQIVVKFAFFLGLLHLMGEVRNLKIKIFSFIVVIFVISILTSSKINSWYFYTTPAGQVEKFVLSIKEGMTKEEVLAAIENNKNIKIDTEATENITKERPMVIFVQYQGIKNYTDCIIFNHVNKEVLRTNEKISVQNATICFNSENKVEKTY